MRRAAALGPLLLLVGCTLPVASPDRFVCRSDADCVETLGYVCVLAPDEFTPRCVAEGAVDGGRRLDGKHDAGAPVLDAEEHERDSGRPGPGEGGPPPDAATDAGPPTEDAGGAPDDGGMDAGDGGTLDVDAGPPPFPGGYVARVALTVPAGRVEGSEPLVDFPFYVALTRDELRTVTSQGLVRSLQGDDIELYLPGDDEPLAHELSSYEPASGALALFVRVPSLTPDADTTLFLYFGSDEITGPTERPALVWDDGFRGVWHLDDVVIGGMQVRDSTGQNHGTARNLGTADSGEAVLQRGLGFGGSNEAVHVSSQDLDSPSSITVEAWARLDAAPSHDYPRIYQKGTGGPGRSVELMISTVSSNPGRLFFRTTFNQNGHSPYYDIPDFQFGEWRHYVGVFDDDADEIRIYVDGERVVTEDQPLAVPTGLTDHWIGNWGVSFFTASSARNWPGRIDEVRVSTAVRSDAWIAASYENQRAPAAFYEVGAVETR